MIRSNTLIVLSFTCTVAFAAGPSQLPKAFNAQANTRPNMLPHFEDEKEFVSTLMKSVKANDRNTFFKSFPNLNGFNSGPLLNPILKDPGMSEIEKLEWVRLLIDKGADLRISDENENKPLHTAALRKKSAALRAMLNSELLKTYPARVNNGNRDRKSVTQLAFESGMNDLLPELVAKALGEDIVNAALACNPAYLKFLGSHMKSPPIDLALSSIVPSLKPSLNTGAKVWDKTEPCYATFLQLLEMGANPFTLNTFWSLAALDEEHFIRVIFDQTDATKKILKEARFDPENLGIDSPALSFNSYAKIKRAQEPPWRAGNFELFVGSPMLILDCDEAFNSQVIQKKEVRTSFGEAAKSCRFLRELNFFEVTPISKTKAKWVKISPNRKLRFWIGETAFCFHKRTDLLLEFDAINGQTFVLATTETKPPVETDFVHWFSSDQIKIPTGKLWETKKTPPFALPAGLPFSSLQIVATSNVTTDDESEVKRHEIKLIANTAKKQTTHLQSLFIEDRDKNVSIGTDLFGFSALKGAEDIYLIGADLRFVAVGKPDAVLRFNHRPVDASDCH